MSLRPGCVESGGVAGELVRYPSGVGGCIWIRLCDDPDLADCGVCFDFTEEQLPHLLNVMQRLAALTPVLPGR